VASFQSKDWKRLAIPRESSIQEAILILENSGAQIILVVDKELKLLGTVTDGDIRRGLLSGVQMTAQVSVIMNSNPVTSTSGAPKNRILDLMHSVGTRQIPLVDTEQRVTGIQLWNELTEIRKLSNSMIIMAGGEGKRLHPQTLEVPKPMLLVGGKPILQHIIERAKQQGVKNFIISINYLKEIIKDFFEDGEWLGISISYLEEENPLGTAGALSLLSPTPSEPFIVTNGDVLADVNYVEMLEFHIRNQAIATMGVKLFEWQHPYGVVTTSGIVIDEYEEKPIFRNTVNAGIYVLSPAALGHVGFGEKNDMPDLFRKLSGVGLDPIVYLIHENWIDVGQLSDLEYANKSAGRRT
jgi:dTDP-glucose pyrophosphorylase